MSESVTWFLIGVVSSVASTVAVTFALRMPLKAYLAEVCCGEDRGLFWWRIVAAMTLLSGIGASIMTPLLTDSVTDPRFQHDSDVLFLQLRFSWLTLLAVMLSTVAVIEYFERKRIGQLS